MSIFNNNSSQMLNNSQQTRYQTRQSTGSNIFQSNNQSNQSANIFGNQNNNQNASNNNIFNNQNSNQATGGNIFSNQSSNSMQNNGGTNLFNNQQGGQNLFGNSGNQGGAKNVFSNSGQTGQNYQSGQGQGQYAHFIKQQEFQKVVMNILEVLQSPAFQKLIIVLQMNHERSKTAMEKAEKLSDNLKEQNIEKYKKHCQKVKERCQGIKNRNTALLIQLFNFKKALVHKYYQNKVRAPQNEIQLEKVVYKIKETAAQIKQKKDQFYLQRQFSHGKTPQKKKQQKMSSIDRPVMELRNATEILSKETMRLQSEFGELVRLQRGQY